MIKNTLTIYILMISLAMSATVTFTIDMSNQDFPNDQYDNIVINGSWNDWAGWGVTLTDQDNDQIFTGELNIEDGTYQYVIATTGSADGWSGWGEIINAPLGSNCDFNPDDEWANYGFTIASDNIEQSYCAGTCNNICENNDDSNNQNDGEYTLVWSDEFNGDIIDQSKWNFQIGTGSWGWGNGEHQYYTARSENAFIEDGKLVIQALFENYSGSNYTSARMTTKDKGDWTYGKIYARIKVPNAGGTWPAFWMMPTNSVYGGWPNSGEIDIMEHYGCDNDHVHATVHNNTYNWNGGIPPTSYSTYTNATQEFHIYEVEWNESELNFYVDEEYLGTYFKTSGGWQQWPYDQEFYIILNLAIGSHFMQCNTDNDLFPQRLEIDYVRVYQKSACVYGDISQDGSVDVVDIVQLVDYILNGINNLEINNCSDLNSDGNLDIVDVVSIVSLIVN